MNAQPRRRQRDKPGAHLIAVARSLRWADASAAQGDFADALAWLRAVEATGDLLPDAYLTKRQLWCGALAQGGVGRQRAEG
jgi:hypothetical protein